MAVPCLEGRYQFVEHIGKGCYGTVDKYWDVASKQFVAIKTMAYTDTEIKAFEQLQRLGAPPHLIMLPLNTFVLESKRMMVFELMEGDLEALWKRSKTLTAEARLNLLCQTTFQVLQGLKWLHLHGQVHGDLKPANVLTKGNMCKLGDFGLSRDVASIFQGEKFGSIFYLAPEMLLETSLTTAIDIWTLGLLLFELYAGDYLFKGKSLEDIQAAHTEFFSHHSQAHLQSLLPAASSQFVDLLSRMLHPDPLHRISAATALEHQWFSNLCLRPSWSSPAGATHTTPTSAVGSAHSPASVQDSDFPGAKEALTSTPLPHQLAVAVVPLEDTTPPQGLSSLVDSPRVEGRSDEGSPQLAQLTMVTSPPRTPPLTPPRIDSSRHLHVDFARMHETLRITSVGGSDKHDWNESVGNAYDAAALQQQTVTIAVEKTGQPSSFQPTKAVDLAVQLAEHTATLEAEKKLVQRFSSKVLTSSDDCRSLSNASFETDCTPQDESLATGCSSTSPTPHPEADTVVSGKKPGHRRQRSKDFVYKLLPSAIRQRYRTLDNE